MADIILKKSSVADKSPLTTDLEYGELALNYNDGKIFYKNSSNIIKSFLDSDNTYNAIDNFMISGDITAMNINNNISLIDSDNFYINSNKAIFIQDSAQNPKFAFDITNAHLEIIGSVYAGNEIATDGTITLGETTSNVDIGSDFRRFRDIYLKNSPNVSSDINLKDDIQPLNESEKLVAQKLKTLIKRYKLKSAIEEKGFDAARYHVGMIAQEVKDTFTEFGLDWHDYGLICYKEDIDKEGNPIENYSIRYEELLAFIISSL